MKEFRNCIKHGYTEFRIESTQTGRFYCCLCQSEKISEYRRNIKIKSVEYKGGRCINCGYDNCIDALDFHHKDPTKKSFQLSDGNTRSWNTILDELDKCDLLCGNCHASEHINIELGKYEEDINIEEICNMKNIKSGSFNKYIIKVCSNHGKSIYIFENRGAYRCTKCMVDRVNKKKNDLKNQIYEYSGCICDICKKKYHRNIIQFHHINPNDKEFSIQYGFTQSYSLEKIIKELNKCAVLCTNCHREVHAGLHPYYLNYNYYL